MALALVLSGCGSDAPSAPPPPEVTVYTVRAEPTANIIELPGRIQAFRTAEVRARVDGIVEARLFTEGSIVTAGRTLFRIDPRPLRADLNAVQATLQRNQATAANAAQDVRRFESLLVGQAISRQEYDSAVARLRTAEADIAQARALVERARLNLGYATVLAPISGRAGRAHVTEGALVTASAGSLLTTIEQTDRVYVNFAQSSSDVLKIRDDIAAGRVVVPPLGGVTVSLLLETGETYGITGNLDFLALTIDQSSGTAALRAEFANPAGQLLPGQFVRARIAAGVRPGGLAVPQRAVRVTPQGAQVIVVSARGEATVRPVVVGDLQGGRWVVTSGLRTGDRVIVDGLQRVTAGQRVNVVAARRPAPAPAAQ